MEVIHLDEPPRFYLQGFYEIGDTYLNAINVGDYKLFIYKISSYKPPTVMEGGLFDFSIKYLYLCSVTIHAYGNLYRFSLVVHSYFYNFE